MKMSEIKKVTEKFQQRGFELTVEKETFLGAQRIKYDLKRERYVGKFYMGLTWLTIVHTVEPKGNGRRSSVKSYGSHHWSDETVNGSSIMREVYSEDHHAA